MLMILVCRLFGSDLPIPASLARLVMGEAWAVIHWLDPLVQEVSTESSEGYPRGGSRAPEPRPARGIFEVRFVKLSIVLE
jgi:hypothetical protein